MVTNKNRDELAHIARNGGGFIVDAHQFSVEDLAHIARNTKEGAYFQVENSDRFSADELAHLARNAKGMIVFA